MGMPIGTLGEGRTPLGDPGYATVLVLWERAMYTIEWGTVLWERAVLYAYRYSGRGDPRVCHVYYGHGQATVRTLYPIG